MIAEERLDGRVVAWWMVSGLFSVAVMLALAGGGLFFAREKLGEARDVVLIGAGAAASLLLLWRIIEPPLSFARWRFAITSELLLMRFGILFLEEKVIPISRLQHVDLSRGPIERMFGLATLVVFTAGTEGASFRLPGLAFARAQELRDQILATRGDDVV